MRSLSYVAFLGVVFISVFFTPFVAAQESRSTISGSVKDAAGAVLPNVKVIAAETRTNSHVQAVSTGEGQFTLPFLPPGDYTLTAELSGFTRYQQQHLALASGDHPIIDIQLQIGSSQQTVEVTSDAPLLSSADASTGQVITTRQVESLPLNGRTPLVLTQLSVGVIQTTGPGTIRPFDNSGASGFSIAGSANKASEILIDGATDAASDNAIAYSPMQDAVQEVRVNIFESDAAYGHTGAGIANQITKSGTNALHGSLYEFNQTSYLAANNFFSNATGTKRPVTRYNQFGGTAGGPVILPKVFNGKDRVFWFFGYEGIKDSFPGQTITTVPTAAERAGDFSALLAAGSQYQIYDPRTAVAGPNGTVTRSPFPNNKIDPTRLNPVALAYLNFYPQPNFAGRADGLNNYVNSSISTDAFNNELARFDFNVTEKNRLFWNFRHNDRIQNVGNVFGNQATGDFLHRYNYGTTLDDVHTFTPTLVGNVRLNFTRYVQNAAEVSQGYDATALGFPSYLASNSTNLQLPRVTFGSCGASFQCIGTTTQTPGTAPFNSYSIFGSLVKVSGNHTFKVGVDARQFRKSQFNYGVSQGAFAFDGTWTKATNAANQSPLGQDLASFLLGLPSSGSYDVNSQYTARNSYLAFFAQDDWRVSSTLTLNAGLRFDRDFPASEQYNRAVNGFDSTTPSPINTAALAAYAANPSPLLAASQFRVNGGLTFASANNRDIYQSQSYNFSPRLGFAWTPKYLGAKTVLRGGYGIFVFPVIPFNNSVNQEGFSSTTPYVATNNNFLTPAATLSDPFPGGIQRPIGSSAGLGTFLGQSLLLFNPNYQNGYSQRWEIGIQHQMPKNFLLEADYIGNHAVRLPITKNINFIPSQYLSTAARTASVSSALTQSVTNPFRGLAPNTGINGSTVQAQQLLLPYPQFGNITVQNTAAGGSYFHALDLRVEKRTSNGLTLITNYQWSKLIERASYLNDFDTAPEKRVSNFDHTHRFVTAITYDLPFGHGRAFLGNSNRAVDLAAGGWTLNAIYTYQTSAPLAWGNIIYNGAAIDYNPRQLNTPALNVNAFDRVANNQPQFNIRTFNSQFGNLRPDAINGVDASLFKGITFTEHVTLQLRLEMFNALNHPIFGAPNLSPTSSSFGIITSQANPARQVTLGGRLVW